ncbi:MAG: hypothetical protein QM770_12960 [Tepidisphaeraceae bacterium]
MARRPHMDSLESRRLFAAVAHLYLINGELIVNGADRPDTIAVRPLATDTRYIQVQVDTVKQPRIVQNFLAASVSTITVNGKDGDDTIAVYQITGAKRTNNVVGGAGNDKITIYTDNAINLVGGNAGSDTISILGGDNRIRLKDGERDYVTAPAATTSFKDKDSKDKITLF